MKKKYSIGFFAGILLFAALLSAGYKKSYDAAKQRSRKTYESAGKKEKETVPVKGEAEKNGGFYICERDGCVIIYLGDRKTVYETTSLHLWELPGEVREEVKKGIYVKDEKQLYGFLENYTS